mgnify:CR=1 FL=1
MKCFSSTPQHRVFETAAPEYFTGSHSRSPTRRQPHGPHTGCMRVWWPRDQLLPAQVIISLRSSRESLTSLLRHDFAFTRSPFVGYLLASADHTRRSLGRVSNCLGTFATTRTEEWRRKTWCRWTTVGNNQLACLAVAAL